jgi:hypothetical protein
VALAHLILMSDPARTDGNNGLDPRAVGDGDARVEQLLLGGLDHYFAGRYEQAVHVWTRVLFLDRGHARARAYIERARSALAERQRHCDELLHRGTAAFEDGQVVTARRLLTAAVEQGAPSEVALAYLGRLDRLSGASLPADATPESPPAQAVAGPESPTSAPRRAWAVFAWLVVTGALAVGAVWFVGAVGELAHWGMPATAAETAIKSPDDPLPTVRASEVALTRARTLFETGHAGDAVRLLGTIPLADPHRAEADRVLADIQRALLRAVDPSSAETMSPVR